jgi:hypothetical protein
LWVVGDGKDYEAGAAVAAGESELDVFRFQEILMAAQVVREGVCGNGGGDAGDADFVKEVGGCAGPGGLVFDKRGDGVDDRGGRDFVESVDDGLCLIGERGSCPVGGVGM